MSNPATIYAHANLATMAKECAGPYGALLDHSIVVQEGRIAAIVPSDATHSFPDAVVHDVQGRWITPGLIDCHTHLVFGGTRVKEWEMRLNGISYTEIARQGGGILNTVRSTRAMSEDELYQVSLPRAKALMNEGVTCLEIKSGYGLTIDDELKMLKVAKWLGESLPIEVSRTLLAAHTVPPEYIIGKADEYVDLIVEQVIPIVAREQLAEAVDVFCEKIAFSVPQSERIWHAARQHGLAVKGHVEQLSNLHGTAALAKYQPWSADHLEYLDDAGVAALAQSGSVAVLLTGAYYFLREQQKPPVEKLRQAQVPMAVATDFNPGTSPFCSLRLAMNMACVLFGLTPEEALAGATRCAARALGRATTHGTLAVGKQADMLIWDIDHPAEIVCSLGVNRLVSRIFRGMSSDGSVI